MLSNMDILTFESVEKHGAYIPSEVYDVATLLVSELAYIHDSVPGLTEAEKSYFPVGRYPSDVYQRGLQLRLTLERLHELIAANPNWYR